MNKRISLYFVLFICVSFVSVTQGKELIHKASPLINNKTGGYIHVKKVIQLSDKEKHIMFVKNKLYYRYPKIITSITPSDKFDDGLYCWIENFTMVKKKIEIGYKFKLLSIEKINFQNRNINRVIFNISDNDIGFACSIDDGSQLSEITYDQFMKTAGDFLEIEFVDKSDKE